MYFNVGLRKRKCSHFFTDYQMNKAEKQHKLSYLSCPKQFCDKVNELFHTDRHTSPKVMEINRALK